MSKLEQQLAGNLSSICEQMARAVESAGRSAASVQLVAVTKYVGLRETAAILAAGCETLGESRPQQLCEKAVEPQLAAARWHLIGHLQRNKVRRTLPLVELIHSVDSLRLLKTINDISGELGLTQRVLLEVNCSGEAEKHGFAPEKFKRLLPELPAFPHVKVCGLMTMAAREGGETVAAKNFSALRQLRDEAMRECPPGISLAELSMGMSHDFEVAIREGATWVRVGSLLFDGV
ncbi:MAG: YggS family pyridoxal phosphate-dependent enzyme [Planctomycetes bacterium]|nr:YggS family pyridoxal phosphate-dependent enzyme [Planctomycetota bacterium]